MARIHLLAPRRGAFFCPGLPTASARLSPPPALPLFPERFSALYPAPLRLQGVGVGVGYKFGFSLKGPRIVLLSDFVRGWVILIHSREIWVACEGNPSQWEK